MAKVNDNIDDNGSSKWKY